MNRKSQQEVSIYIRKTSLDSFFNSRTVKIIL